MGGQNSNMFMYYRILLFQGFTSLKKHVEGFVTFMEIMMENSMLPCFLKFDLAQFEDRFKPILTDSEREDYVKKLIDQSLNNWRTAQYDQFQKISNNISV